MEWINRLADSNAVQMMTAGEKITSGLMVAAVGMTITFLALIVLWVALIVMSKVLGQTNKKTEASKPAVKAEPSVATPVASAAPEQDDEELVAVLTAAVAASLKTSVHNIVVKNIVRVPDARPTWSRAGLTEQINTRF